MKGILDGEQPPDDAIRWLSHAGLTTRSIRDTALVLDVLAEHGDDGKVPTWGGVLAAQREFRIGLADNVRVDQEVSHAFDNAVATLRSLGHAVSHTSAPLTDFSKGIANIESDRKAVSRLAFNTTMVPFFSSPGSSNEQRRLRNGAPRTRCRSREGAGPAS